MLDKYNDTIMILKTRYGKEKAEEDILGLNYEPFFKLKTYQIICSVCAILLIISLFSGYIFITLVFIPIVTWAYGSITAHKAYTRGFGDGFDFGEKNGRISDHLSMLKINDLHEYIILTLSNELSYLRESKDSNISAFAKFLAEKSLSFITHKK